ncbi:DUF488 family protein [Arachidicoccus sp.]|uniref:DUF488 domain-containing protein n=1 Tax=Arachidicoccus sp. TaxID=1872624 RepID=UPI003D254FC3
MKKPSTIYTIGHSTRDLDDFLFLLTKNKIELLADVRSFPGSRKYPQFNRENLAVCTPEVGVEYMHFKDLGGRRKLNKGSLNTSWHNTSFRSYADYMETKAFKNATAELIKIAKEKKTCIMCSEAVWWRCHRSMIADYLKSKNWTVFHIISSEKMQEHPYTQPAKIINGKLVYGPEIGLFES